MHKVNWRKLFGAILIMSMSLAVIGTAFAASMPGAVWTSDLAGGTNINIYDSKEHVYLNGGPRKSGSAGLPDGMYWVKVTAPDGTILGKSTSAIAEVAGGVMTRYQLSSIVKSASSGFTAQGYDDTPNPGGTYKVWASMDENFPNSLSKTDNFKVAQEYVPMGLLQVKKFHDLNADGDWDDTTEPEILGWGITIEQDVDGAWVALAGPFATPVSEWLSPGTYRVTEEDRAPWWRATTPVFEIVIILDQTTGTVEFGNVQLGQLVVQKFHDVDNFGVWDQDEIEIPWGITIGGGEYTTPTTGTTPWSAYVLPGAYTVTEDTVPGWELSYGTNPANVTVIAGQTTTVTFGNKVVVETECYSETAWAAEDEGGTRFVEKGNWATYVEYDVSAGHATYPLYAGQHYQAGLVHVRTEGGALYVKYELTGGAYKDGWVGTWTKITEAHLHVASAPAGIPQTKKGGPVPGQFEHKWHAEEDEITKIFEFGPITITGTGPVYIAAHAVVWWCGIPGDDGNGTMTMQQTGPLTGLDNALQNVIDKDNGRAAEVIQILLDGGNPGNKPETQPGQAKKGN